MKICFEYDFKTTELILAENKKKIIISNYLWQARFSRVSFGLKINVEPDLVC